MVRLAMGNGPFLTFLLLAILNMEAEAKSVERERARKSKKSDAAVRGYEMNRSGAGGSNIAMIKRKTPPPGDLMLTPMAGFNFLLDTSFGARASYRILDNGFIKAINNSVNIEASAMYHKDNIELFGLIRSGIYYTGGLRWDFHVGRNWTVFASPDIGIFVPSADSFVTETSFAYGANAGGMWHMGRALALRLEYASIAGSYMLGLAIKI
jgi:hypothetical protein